MGANSLISWTDHTFNPWEGCTKVSGGCKNCYAATRDQRFHAGQHWGPGAPRRRTSPTYWNQPLLWHKKAARREARSAGQLRRPRVFCASLADWLDDEVPAEWLFDLLTLIHQTPTLDWQLLTKRPENWARRLRAAADQCTVDPLDITDRIHAWISGERIWQNVWIGTSVEDQAAADSRIPHLLQIPARTRFLSCEPLLGPVILPYIDFPKAWRISKAQEAKHQPKCSFAQTRGALLCDCDVLMKRTGMEGITWVICGGESGPGFRHFDPDWARSLRDQCQAADVAFFMKQMSGKAKPLPHIPADLMIREFPQESAFIP